MTKPVPEGYEGVTPYLIVDDAKAAIDFYTRAFGAEEVMRLPMGDRIGHAELKIAGGYVMLADEFPDMHHLSPKSRGGPMSSQMFYVDDVDSVFRRAIEAGAKQQRPVEDQFWGDRMGSLTDPFGHVWSIATHVRDVSPDEMQARMAEWSAKQKQGEPA